jgi:molybdate transport system regulatory protein
MRQSNTPEQLSHQATLKTQIRLLQGTDIAIGPGKAELLAAIAEKGSISGAARHMGMSYRRAWLLVETMNRCFKQPVVISTAGGKHGGGAQLSRLGQQALEIYRAMLIDVEYQVAQHATDLYALLRDPTSSQDDTDQIMTHRDGSHDPSDS